MATTVDKQFVPKSKQISYLGRDFDQLKQNLIDYAAHYFPKTYKDFNNASPGMMFIEMAAYVGDVLSFYTDYQFKEGLLNSATERKNVIGLSNYLGYVPKPSKPSVGQLDVYQIVPSKYSGSGVFVPDDRYALKVLSGMQSLSSNKVAFISTSDVDFSLNSKMSPREDSVFSTDPNTNEPTFFLLKKSTNIYSGKIVQQTFNVLGQNPYLQLKLNEDNVIQILNVTDSDNNLWYQVDYLAQDLIMLPVENNLLNFESLSKFQSSVPNIIKFIRTDRRYVVSVDENNNTTLQFGSSTDSVNDSILIPNADVLGPNFQNASRYNLKFDSSAFLKSNSYGIAPYNTTITVSYVIGGGIDANANADDIRSISSISFQQRDDLLPSEENLFNTVKSSVKINNPYAIIGGQNEESIFEIKQNAISRFASQNRIVTKEDYLTKTLTMPSQFGSIAKVFVSTESNLFTDNAGYIKGLLDANNNIVVDQSTANFRKINLDGINQFGVNLYVLSYDENKNLIPSNDALIFNLKNYLSQFRIMSDRVNIIDGFVINIGINFTILTYSNYNKQEVLSNCISTIQNFFNIDNWQFSQPINLSQLELQIANVQGVQSIPSLKIVNLTTIDGTGKDYSIYEYDITSATKNKILYPPIDPTIFEVKYPNTDINGKCL